MILFNRPCKAKRVLIFALCCSTAILGQPAGELGRISGLIADDLGKPIVGLLATLHRDGDEKSIPITIGPDGRYQANSLGLGNYRLCVQGPLGSLVLNSCQWAGRTTPTSIRAGATSAALNAQVETGIPLRIRIVDPNGILNSRSAAAMPMAGVWTSEKLFIPMRVDETNKVGAGYIVTVPADRDLLINIPGPAIRYQIGSQILNSNRGILSPTRLKRADTQSQIVVTILGPAQ